MSINPNDISENLNPIIDATLISVRKSEPPRDYLGASSIGNECLRKTQFAYQHVESEISARAIRVFDQGHTLEGLVADWLKKSGVKISTRNENGEQFGFSDANGRFRGHVDGIITQSPLPQIKTPCIWECKTMNSTNWKELQKHGLLFAQPKYYSQIQVYMAYLELQNDALLTAFNKDSGELYFELVPYDAEMAQQMIDRASLIIKATENNELLPPVAISPDYYICKFCEFYKKCRG